MIHSSDLLAMAIVTVGNKYINLKFESTELEKFSNLLQVALHKPDKNLDKLVIIDSEDKKYLYVDWIKKSTNNNIEKFILLSKYMFQESKFNRKLNPLSIDKKILLAFEGQNVFIVGTIKDSKIKLYYINIIVPPSIVMSGKNFLEFIEKNAQFETLKKLILWQNENNLNFYDGRDWGGFRKCLTDQKLSELLEIWDFCISNNELDSSFYSEWNSFAANYRNKNKTVTYKAKYIGEMENPEIKYDLVKEKNNLLYLLKQLEVYSKENKTENWAQHFKSVQNILIENKIEQNGFIQIFQDSGLSQHAVSLLEAALRSDVFGGMGSWNDVPFMYEKKYCELSDKLFMQIFNSIMAAINYKQ